VTDERALLIDEIEKNIADGMTVEIIPAIPGVREIVVSRGPGGKDTTRARKGPKTVRAVHLSMADLEPFERTAALLAYLLVPGVKAHRDRIKIYKTICHWALRNDIAWPKKWRDYAFQDQIPFENALNRVRRLYRERHAAGLMALGLMVSDDLPSNRAVPKVRELAEAVSESVIDLDKNVAPDPKNVEFRVWRGSISVIHLALAELLMCYEYQREFNRLLLNGGDEGIDRVVQMAKMSGLELLSLLAHADSPDRLLAQAEFGAQQMRRASKLVGDCPHLIRFSQG
jgi:hypothetical protein